MTAHVLEQPRPAAGVSFREVTNIGRASSDPTTGSGSPHTGRAPEVIVDVTHGGEPRTVLQSLAALLGAAGMMLVIPLAILAIGVPLAFAVRVVIEAVRWIFAAVF